MNRDSRLAGDLAIGSQPVTRLSARDVVVDYVRKGILTGQLAPGQRLAVNEVAGLLGVSHTPTREAFQYLAAEGLIQINAYRGAHVTDLSTEEYEEISLMRMALEALAARTGAELIDDRSVEIAKAHLAAMGKAAKRGDVDQFIQIDREFHRTHYMASGRQRLWERIISLRYMAERYTRLGYRLSSATSMESAFASHNSILQAVEQRDGEAAERLILADLRVTFDTVSEELRNLNLKPLSR